MAVLSKPVLPSLPNLTHLLASPQHRRPLLLALFTLLLLRSRVFSLPSSLSQSTRSLSQSTRSLSSSTKSTVATFRKKLAKLTKSLQLKLHRKLTPAELAKVLQQVYLDDPAGPEGSKVILAPYRDRVVKVPIHPIPRERFERDRAYFPPLPSQSPTKPPSTKPPSPKSLSPTLLTPLLPLLRIAIPSWRAPEAGIVLAHSAFLVLRTVLSILVARLDGRIVRDLVRADARGFAKGLGLWFLLAVPSTVTNSMIRHFQSLLAARLRTRLTRYLHDLYLSSYPDLRYYRAPGYLDGVDQYLTADVEAWAGAVSGLYGNILKPSLDLLLFTSQLSSSLGARGTLLLFVNYYTTVRILRWASPPFALLAAEEARLEGEYRRAVGRVGREAEEVAFYDGGGWERRGVGRVWEGLRGFLGSVYRIKIKYEWTEDYVIKYLWSAAGYALIAVPILYTRTKRSLSSASGAPGSAGGTGTERDRTDEAVASRTETYISNRRLLLSLADAGGRLMYAYKDLLELAGLTGRLYTLVSTLLNMPPHTGRVVVELGDGMGELGEGEGIEGVGEGEGEGEGGKEKHRERHGEGEVLLVRGVDVRVPRRKKLGGAAAAASGKQSGKVDASSQSQTSEAGAEDKGLRADLDAQQADPDPPLVKNLSLTLRRGEHLMITGSNGVGKSAVARVLGGLWEPVASASESNPGNSGAGAGEGAGDNGEGAGVDGEGSGHNGEQEDGRRTGYIQMPRDETEADVLVRRVLYERKQQQLSAKGRSFGRQENPAQDSHLPTSHPSHLPTSHPSHLPSSHPSHLPSGAETHWRPRPTLYVVPQRSYMTSGSLLEQIIYPCSYANFVRLTSAFGPPSAAAAASASGGLGSTGGWEAAGAGGVNLDSTVPTPAPTPAPRPPALSRTASISNLFSTSLSSLPSLPSLPLPSLLSRPPTHTILPPPPHALREIHSILAAVHLGYLVEREGGLEVRKEWRDVLSGGEKQRLGMARVLWWRPRWAVLDECTSAVSSDVEGRMYEAAKAMDITLITISLRPSLMKYHTQLLTLSGPSPTSASSSSSGSSSEYPGKWTLTRIGTPEERMSIQKEIKVLEEKLQEVEGWERRVRELEGLLGVQELDEENMEGGKGAEEKEEEERDGEDEELEKRLLAKKKDESSVGVDTSAPEVEVKDDVRYVANGNRYSVLPEEDGVEDPMDAQEMQVEAEIEAEAVGGESLA